MTVEELKSAFSVYLHEIENCENAKCYFALLHIILTIPDICAGLESDPLGPKINMNERYTNWCTLNLSKNKNINADDLFQMRNALFHDGSSTAGNTGKTHQTKYIHFSYLDPDTFGIEFHGTTDPQNKILNVHIDQLVSDMKKGLEKWFGEVASNLIKSSYVQANIHLLIRKQKKEIIIPKPDGTTETKAGKGKSST